MRKSTFVIYVTFIFVVGLLCVEVLLRFLKPQPMLSFQHYYPSGVVGLKPNFKSNVSGFPKDKQLAGKILKAYRVPIQTNSFGFLGHKEFDKKKTSNRIISLGGSISMGWPFGADFSYGSYLRNNIPRTEVIQAPQIGTSLAHMYEHYLKVSGEFEADLLLVQSRPTLMEVDDLVQDTFGQDAFELAELRKMKLESKVVLKMDMADNPQIEFANENERELLTTRINDKLYMGSRQLFAFYEFSHIARALLNSSQPDSFFKDYLNQAPDKSRRPQKSLAYLRGLRDLAQSRGTKLVYIVIPNRYGCMSGVFNAWKNFLSLVEKEKVKVVTFFDQFCDFKEYKPIESEFLTDEFHPTREAYQKISARVLKEVQSLGLLNQ